MALREDIAKLDRYIEQLDFLYQHKIDNKQSLQSKRSKLVSELKQQIVERRKLNTEKEKAARHHNGPKIEENKAKISDVSRKIRELRKQIKLCDAVFVSSDKVQKETENPITEPLSSKARNKPLQSRERF